MKRSSVTRTQPTRSPGESRLGRNQLSSGGRSFNEQLGEKLDKTEEALKSLLETQELPRSIRSPIRKAKKALKDLLSKRQKMIRIADCLEYRWELVKEYAEDEKRLCKAEKGLEKKIASRKRLAA